MNILVLSCHIPVVSATAVQQTTASQPLTVCSALSVSSYTVCTSAQLVVKVDYVDMQVDR